MKKFMYSVLAAATMLFATTSCSQEEEILGGNSANMKKVTFTVELPSEDATSRAITYGDKNVEVGKGQLANKLIWALYENGKYDVCLDSKVIDGTINTETKKHEFKAQIDMVKGLTYKVLFFAYNNEACAFQLAEKPEETDLKALTLKNSLYANQEGYDAFVKCHQHVVNDEEVTTVTLKRPFAQINVATTDNDLMKADKLKALVNKSELTIYGVPTQYNVLTGEATQPSEFTIYKAKSILENNDVANRGKYPNETVIVNETPYKYLNMAYVLAGATESSAQSMHHAVFNFYRSGDENPVRTIDIPNLPIQRNWRTNIIGDILTQTENFQIVIDEKFESNHTIIEGEVVSVDTPEELQEAINNAEGPTVIKLTEDFGNVTRNVSTPSITIVQKVGTDLVIDGCGYKFNGTFYVHGGAQGNSSETLTFKNIKFEHADGKIDFISSDDAAEVKRYAHNVTIDNCTFTGNNNGDVVAVRMRQAYNIIAKNCEANNLHSFAQVTSSEFIAKNVTINAGRGFNFLNSGKINIENCNVTATKEDGYGIRIDAETNSFLNVKGSTITAYEPIVLRESTASFKLNLENNTLNKTSDYHIVVTSGDTPIIIGADEYNVYPLGIVVSNAEELISALTKGQNVKMLNDIEVSENTTIEIKNGVELTLDLNGKTLSSTNTRTGTHNDFILVKGTLNVSNGTITYKHTGNNMGWNGCTNLFDITAGGILNINNVTANNLGGTDMNFAVHMNNWGEVTLNAENCEFLATYCGVRVFNSGFDDNNVTIKNSKLTGSTRAFWVHNYIGDFDTTQHPDANVKARLKFSYLNNNNTFEITGTAASPIRYGFSNPVYYVIEEDAIYVQSSNAVTYYGYNGDATEVTIPAEVNGVPLTATSNSAFAYNKKIEKVIFPQSLVTLGGYTFQECSSLKSVELPNKLEEIGNRAFRKCVSLKEITLPNSLVTIVESAFQQSGIKSISFPENVTYIGKMALGACSNLETIKIEAKTVTIGDYCARACANLKSVYIYSDTITFEKGSMYFTNKENADASSITFYVKTKDIADALYTAMSVSHSYGMKIVNIDGNETFYNTLK